MKTLLLITLVMVSLSAFAGNVYYAATNGTAGSAGSLVAPWSLSYAIDSAQTVDSTIAAGDTLYVRGGNYGPSTWTCKLHGSAGSPIVIRNYNRERVILYGTLSVDARVWSWATEAAYVWLWGFEITSNATDRTSALPHGQGYGDVDCPTGMADAANGVHSGNRVINCVFHDLFSGIYAYQYLHDFEIDGCLFYNIGIVSTDNSGATGYPVYMNSLGGGWKKVNNSIAVNNLDYNFHFYTGSNYLDSIVVRGNILQTGNVLFSGGHSPHVSDTVTNNYLYGGILRLGQDSRIEYSVVTNNRVIGPDNYYAISFEGGDSLLTVTGNTLLANWYTWSDPNDSQSILRIDGYTGAARYPNNTFMRTYPAGTHPDKTNALPVIGDSSYYLPNAYEPKRGHIAVYNFDQGDTVSVKLTTGFASGDSAFLYNASNLYGDPADTLVVGADSTISVPMSATRWSMATPEALSAPTNHYPLWGNFIVTGSTVGGAAQTEFPVVTADPQNASVWRSNTASFSVTATGVPSPTYQWQKNSVNISGATSSSLTVTANPSDHGSLYRCIVTNSAGSDTSATASLSVILNKKGFRK